MTEKTKEKIKRKEKWIEECKEIFDNEELFTEKTNKLWLVGSIEEEFEYYCMEEGINLYRTYINIDRLSREIDRIPIVVSEDFKDINWRENVKGRKIQVAGQFRTRNRKDEDGKSHLDSYAFLTSAWFLYDEEQFIPENRVYIYGTICKGPVFRKTLKNKEITEITIAVNRSEDQSDYIPTIAWFEDAHKTRNYKVGDKIKLYGKFQSRGYHNNERVAYELSVSKII